MLFQEVLDPTWREMNWVDVFRMGQEKVHHLVAGPHVDRQTQRWKVGKEMKNPTKGFSNIAARVALNVRHTPHVVHGHSSHSFLLKAVL